MENAEVGSRQYATFRVDNLLFGVDVHDVQEILRRQEMTQVPLSSPVVRGLINLRGQIIAAIDLRRRLHQIERSIKKTTEEKLLSPSEGAEPSMNVIVRLEDEVVSLLVDEIGDVLELPSSHYETTPPTVSGPLRELVSGVYKLEKSILLVLNTKNAVNVTPAP